MAEQQLTVRKKSLELLSTKLQQLDPARLADDEVNNLMWSYLYILAKAQIHAILIQIAYLISSKAEYNHLYC